MAEEKPKPGQVRERLIICEIDRARISRMNPALTAQKPEERRIHETTKTLIERTIHEAIESVRNPFGMQQPPGTCREPGITCSRCAIDPDRFLPSPRISRAGDTGACRIIDRILPAPNASVSAANTRIKPRFLLPTAGGYGI
ncbi:MAG: hypothetical protein ABFC78_10015 [Methanoregula sp.]